MEGYYIYIITNNKSNTILYIGVTNNLIRRLDEHKKKSIEGFSQKYNLTKLLYFEQFSDIKQALEREKQLKRWHRQWKINFIRKTNPDFEDLSTRL